MEFESCSSWQILIQASTLGNPWILPAEDRPSSCIVFTIDMVLPSRRWQRVLLVLWDACGEFDTLGSMFKGGSYLYWGGG